MGLRLKGLTAVYLVKISASFEESCFQGSRYKEQQLRYSVKFHLAAALLEEILNFTKTRRKLREKFY